MAGRYLQEKRAATRETTYGMYRLILERVLLPWLDEQGIEYPDQLDTRGVASWVTYLREQRRTPQGKPLSETTVRTYSTTANFFLAWLEQHGAAAVRAKPPPRRRTVVDVLTRDEMRRLEDAAWHPRDKLLIRIMADTGVRLGEALALRETDLREPSRREFMLAVGGKTGERLVPLPTPVARRLREYIRSGRPPGYHGTLVFVGLHAVDEEYRIPGRTTIARMLRDAGARAGIEKRVHAHLLRHSAITHMLRGGMNPILVAEYAGHASLEMIRSTYSHLDRADLYREAMRILGDED